MCAPSCSGAGGLALYRYSSVGKTYDFSSKGGSSSYTYKENEPLGSLQASGEQGWFNGRFMEFKNAEQFPMDQHMLGSLCCDPDRYLFIIGSCESEDWVNAPSVWMAYLGMKLSHKVVDSANHFLFPDNAKLVLYEIYEYLRQIQYDPPVIFYNKQSKVYRTPSTT